MTENQFDEQPGTSRGQTPVVPRWSIRATASSFCL